MIAMVEAYIRHRKGRAVLIATPQTLCQQVRLARAYNVAEKWMRENKVTVRP